jgi:hypothetical protein
LLLLRMQRLRHLSRTLPLLTHLLLLRMYFPLLQKQTLLLM